MCAGDSAADQRDNGVSSTFGAENLSRIWRPFYELVMTAFVAGPAPLIIRSGGRSDVCLGRRKVSDLATRPRRPKARWMVPRASVATQVPASVEKGLRSKLWELYDSTPCMPIMVRLAWHDAGTYNKDDDTGGPNGSIRFMPESGHGANAGLKIARDFLEPIKKEFPDISYADLYQLASIVAIEYAQGPKIPFRFGREDVTEAECTPDGRLPDADKRLGHLREIFYRMGFSDAEITVLSGAHTLGRAHMERSGFDGPWTREPVVFDNSYFKEILKDNPDPDLLRLESDMALLDDPETRALVEKYAADQEVFFKDYIAAHTKLSELGCKF